MTNTTLVNSAVLSAGYGVNSTQTALQSATTAYNVELTLTNGSASGDPTKPIRVYVASSSLNLSTTTAPQQLNQAAFILEVRPSASPASTTSVATGLIPRLGDYVYVWLEVPNYKAAAIGLVNLWENA